MSISPEKRYCLGGLMKDIDKELSDGDLDTSNDGTTYKSSQDKIFSSNDTKFTPYLTFFSPSLENINSFLNQKMKSRKKVTTKMIIKAYSLKKIFWLLSTIKKLLNSCKKVYRKNPKKRLI